MGYNGWIRDHRRELESDIWKMPPLYHRIWQWLKYQVNHDDDEIPMRDGTKMQIKRGQRLTSYRQIGEGVGWYERGVWRSPNPKTIKAILDWLEAQGMITITHGNSQYTVVTLCNYSAYQERDRHESNTQVTLGKHSLDTNKNDKNDKNDKNKESLGLGKAIDDFKDFRKKIKKPMTDYAVHLLLLNLDKLATDDETKIAILNQSIVNGWQGVFALKEDKPNATPLKTTKPVEGSSGKYPMRDRSADDPAGMS